VSHSLVGVLRDFKPRRVLLTTFTFNPAFFEAAVMPAAFRPDGCEINVLVDGGQLAASTFGSFAQHIGSRYAVAPVRAPHGGVFHPKIALLDVGDEQVLCVGSGNLTASGLARQLECFDISRLAAEPGLAEQTKVFLLDLARLCEVRSPRAAAMLFAASTWICTAGGAAPAGRAASLIHTLARPADEQMLELLRRDGREVRRLTVLAPFHSSDGSAIRGLHERVGNPGLHIAHLGKVPCEQAAYGDATYVSPRERVAGHPLHAKVFEFITDDGVLLVTGSVNATRQSLNTTKNVEVSIARYAAASPFKWKPATPTCFAPQEQDFDPQSVWSLEASLNRGDCLQGFVVGAGSGGARISWELSSASLYIADGTTTLDRNGLLAVQLESPVSAGHGALMLHITGPQGISATTWVNDEHALSASLKGKRFIMRPRGNGEIDSDYRFVTTILLQALEGEQIHRRGNTSKGGETSQLDDGQPPDEVFSYEHWVQAGRLRIPPGQKLGRSEGFFLSRVLSLLLPQPEVDPHKGENGLVLSDFDPTDEEGEQRDAKPPPTTDTGKRSRPAQKDQQELLKACQAVREAFESGRRGIASAEILALAVCALDMERAQSQFLAPAANELLTFDAHRVLVLWMDTLSRYDFDGDVRAELLPIVCFIAAATAAVPARMTPREQHLPQLRSSIERLAGHRLSTDEVMERLQRGMRDELALRLDPRFRDAALAQAPLLAGSCSLDDLLRIALDDSPGSRPPLSMEAIPVALALFADRRKGWRAVKPTHVRSSGCPICYLNFNNTERRELTYQRWILHKGDGGGQHVLVYPDDISRFS
jgi:hypothetical protein